NREQPLARSAARRKQSGGRRPASAMVTLGKACACAGAKGTLAVVVSAWGGEMQKVLDAGSDGRSLTDDEWLERLAAANGKAGYAVPLGARHIAALKSDGPVLLVTFERLAEVRARTPEQLPFGQTVARVKSWSHLGLIARGDTWFRDPAVYRFFDRLV